MSQNQFTETDALIALQQGRKGSLDYFFDQHYPALCYFAHTILQDQSAAEDIAGEAFVKLWQRHDRFDAPLVLKTFLYRTVRNAAIDNLRRAKTLETATREAAYVADSEEPSVLQAIVRSETLSQVYTCLNDLPPKYRQVVTLFYLDERSYEEIARELQLSVNAVRNRKMRALHLLRGTLGISMILLLFHMPDQLL